MREPATERLAGVAIPLSAIRGERDSGIGEFRDLVPFAEWATSLGQRLIGLLPLFESAPGEASPYSALSSFALDPLYVSLADLTELSGTKLPDPPDARGPLERERVYAWKRPLLERAFAAFETLPAGADRRRAFEAFRAERAWLADYALFRALLESDGWRSWLEWPAALRDRETRALERARDRRARSIAFFEWLQFAAEDQWRRAHATVRAEGVVVYGDLPFAPALQSADVWANRDAFDLERTSGAPPDAFSPTGQRWGLPMFDWSAQRAGGWRWLRARVRRMRALYDLVRVDHLVGLFRTYAFREGAEAGVFDPAEEDRQIAQGREILELMRGEAAPAKLVAEDLGVIPDFVRETLRALELPGYKVFRWEVEDDRPTPPARYPECSLATTGTHDTETLAEWWRTAKRAERLATLTAIGKRGQTTFPSTSNDEGREKLSDPVSDELDGATRLALLEALWRSPSRYVVLPLQDLFGWEDRVNVPATVGGANWRWRLPARTSALPRDPRIAALVRRSLR